MAHKTLVGGTAYEIGGGRTLVGGTGYSIDKGRTLVDGTAYDISFGTTIGSLPVGSFVKLDGNSFRIVNQGNPSASIYDESCDGTWLMRVELLGSRSYGGTTNNYATSSMHSYLNGTYLGEFSAGIQSIIKQVKIPYIISSASSQSYKTLSSGLSTKIFLPSSTEVGMSSSTFTAATIGERLSYFSSGENSLRVAHNINGGAAAWWLRTPVKSNYLNYVYVNAQGIAGQSSYSTSNYVRPTLIIPSETMVDSELNVIT